MLPDPAPSSAAVRVIADAPPAAAPAAPEAVAERCGTSEEARGGEVEVVTRCSRPPRPPRASPDRSRGSAGRSSCRITPLDLDDQRSVGAALPCPRWERDRVRVLVDHAAVHEDPARVRGASASMAAPSRFERLPARGSSTRGAMRPTSSALSAPTAGAKRGSPAQSWIARVGEAAPGSKAPEPGGNQECSRPAALPCNRRRRGGHRRPGRRAGDVDERVSCSALSRLRLSAVDVVCVSGRSRRRLRVRVERVRLHEDRVDAAGSRRARPSTRKVAASFVERQIGMRGRRRRQVRSKRPRRRHRAPFRSRGPEESRK